MMLNRRSSTLINIGERRSASHVRTFNINLQAQDPSTSRFNRERKIRLDLDLNRGPLDYESRVLATMLSLLVHNECIDLPCLAVFMVSCCARATM